MWYIRTPPTTTCFHQINITSSPTLWGLLSIYTDPDPHAGSTTGWPWSLAKGTLPSLISVSSPSKVVVSRRWERPGTGAEPHRYPDNRKCPFVQQACPPHKRAMFKPVPPPNVHRHREHIGSREKKVTASDIVNSGSGPRFLSLASPQTLLFLLPWV